MLSFDEIELALGKFLVKSSGREFFTPFSSIELDSRKVSRDTLFLAIKGDRFDAHDFVENAFELGVRTFILQKETKIDAAIFVVTDTRRALGALAKFYRQKLGTKLIAIVGSNGKTTTTQMCARMLEKSFGDAAHSTRGNFNNEIGCAQTLLALKPEHKVGAIEVGMNHPGEMAILADIVRPDVVLMTNAQREHQEFLLTVRDVAYENGMMIVALNKSGKFICPIDDEYAFIWKSLALVNENEVITYSHKSPADFTLFGGEFKGEGYTKKAKISFTGEHMLHDAVGALAACVTLGCDFEKCVCALEEFKALKGRGEVTTTNSGNWTIIDESYNANPDSVMAAIDVLSQMSGEKILLLGDMGEIGENGPQYHNELGVYAKNRGIDKLLTLGELAKNASLGFGRNSIHFENRQELIAWLKKLSAKKLSITVKASHSMHFEEFVELLKAQ